MSMPSSPRPRMLRHPSHIHPLFEFHLAVGGEFICDGCRTCGYEKSYRCNYCNFDLHEYCATCPIKLRSGLHVHELTLVNLVATRKVCDICEECVDGLFYTCSFCDFNVHPVCTQIPTKLQHGHLPNHSLTLRQPRMSSWCVVCWDACTSWFMSSRPHLDLGPWRHIWVHRNSRHVSRAHLPLAPPQRTWAHDSLWVVSMVFL